MLFVGGCGRLDFDPRGLASDATSDSPDSLTDGDLGIPGLIAWYPMDTVNPGGTPDATGHGHDAACLPAACPAAIAGIHGGALLFGGVNDHLGIPGAGFDLPLGTVATWFRLDTAPTAGNFVELFQRGYMNGPSSFEAGFVATGQLLGCGGDAITQDYAETMWPSLGVWHHLGCVWDATTVTTYVDGIERSTNAFATAYDTHPLTLGANNDNGSLSGFFQGGLDDFRVYDRALTPQEITLLATP